MTGKYLSGTWGLILGASSGFGAATAKELSEHGMNIIGVHLDRKAAMSAVERLIKEIQGNDVQAMFFNVNAADGKKRCEVLDQIQSKIRGSTIAMFLHSLAFGTLKPFIADDPKGQITKDQMEMTLDVMAHSLIYWVQGMMGRKLLGRGSRVFAMTSSGGSSVWSSYGAVSAAKAALESHIRQLAMELAPFGVTANSIRAGVTDTPALRMIPGNEKIMEFSKLRNPHRRLTTPEDVARAISTLCNSGTDWITGNVIGADGGEGIVG